MKELKPLYIRGWKGLSEYTGFHWRTLQKWHYERARIPFIRALVHTNRSRWVITPERVHLWLTQLEKTVKKIV